MEKFLDKPGKDQGIEILANEVNAAYFKEGERPKVKLDKMMKFPKQPTIDPVNLLLPAPLPEVPISEWRMRCPVKMKSIICSFNVMKYFRIFLLLCFCSAGAVANPDADNIIKASVEAGILGRLDVLELMKSQGWDVTGVTKSDLGGMIALQKGGKYMGYCVVESGEQSIPAAKMDLSGITKIQFEDPLLPNGKPYFYY